MQGRRKSVRFWPNAYQSQDPSEVRAALEAAAENQVHVTVTGDETQETGPKGSYTQFMAKSVMAGAQTNGGGSGSTTTGGGYSEGRQTVISRQWAVNAALASLGGTVEDLSEVFNRAKIFFGVVHEDDQWT